jgi:hypothetical protein
MAFTRHAALFALLSCASLLPAAPMMCSTQSLADYTGLTEGCTIGGTLFSNFSAQPSFLAGGIDAADVSVTPLASTSTIGFRFSLPQQLLSPQGILIGYRVSNADSARITLEDASASGDGVVTGVLNACVGGTYSGGIPTGCSGSDQFALTFQDAIGGDTTAVLSFPLSSLDVFTDLVADGGINGSASLVSATNLFTPVPEPAHWITLSVMLGVLGRQSLRRRKLR